MINEMTENYLQTVDLYTYPIDLLGSRTNTKF